MTNRIRVLLFDIALPLLIIGGLLVYFVQDSAGESHAVHGGGH